MSGSDESNDGDEVRRAIRNAEKHRDSGELPEAAGWYRRAAKLLLEDGVEDRALEFARLAADLEDDDEPASSAGKSDKAPDRGGSSLRAKAKSGTAMRGETGRHKAISASEARADTTGKNKAQPSGRTGQTGKHKTAKEVFAAAPAVVVPKPAPPKSASMPIPLPMPAKTGPVPSSLASAAPLKFAKSEVIAPAPAPAPALKLPLPRPSVQPQTPSVSKPSAPLPAKPAGNAPRAPLPPSASAPAPAPRPSAPADNGRAVSESSSWTMPPPAPQAATVDYIRARIQSLPFLDELSSDQLREVSRQVRVLECDDGELIFDVEAPSGPMFVVTSGNIHVETIGNAPFTATMKEDSVVGVTSALYRERRLTRARARGPVEAFAFAPSLVRSLVRESAVLRAFLEGVARARVAALLPHLSESLGRCESAARARFVQLAELVTLEDGAALQLEGVPSRALYMIGAGEAELFGEPIPTRVVRTSTAGDVIGADSLRNEQPALTTVRAARTMLVARLSRAAYRTWISEFPSVANLLRDVTAD